MGYPEIFQLKEGFIKVDSVNYYNLRYVTRIEADYQIVKLHFSNGDVIDLKGLPTSSIVSSLFLNPKSSK